MFNSKNILITGGTGSFGKLYVKTLLERDFEYNSLTNPNFLSISEINQLATQ